MFWPQQKVDSITAAVKKFYEATPFPNYEGIESAADLATKAQQGGFADWLDKLIPFNSLVLDAGSGTGQLPIFLSLSSRRVVGTDMSLASLKLAQDFKRRHRLDGVSFYQMNLFHPIFKPDTFDAVICTGVLHHTSSPQEGFMALSRLVKPGGLMVIGLYHKGARLINNWRRLIFKFSGSSLLWLDPRFKHIKDKQKFKAWFEDQYRHPHESSHTVKEVTNWFTQAGFEVTEILPRALLQFVLTGAREGGLFIMIGRKNNYVKNLFPG